MSIPDDLLNKALDLPRADRAEIARQLLLTLQPNELAPGLDESWIAEIEARLESVDRGEVSTTPWRDLLDRLRAALPQQPVP